MHRIDTPTADPNANGAGKAGFRPGAPPGVASTRMDASWFNDMQESVCVAIEAAGIALVKGQQSQLLDAINTLVAGSGTRAVAKAALGALKLASDTSLSATLRAAARKASTRRIVAVGDNGSIVSSNGYTPFGIETVGSAYVGDFID